MKVFHLSHTDLDGYGAQVVSNHYFDDVICYNSNYGREINERFKEILNDLKASDQNKNIVLITDLNLNMEQCKKFEEEISVFKNTKLILLDHHQSGLECFENFSWYYLDNLRCATKITYDFFSDIYGKDEKLSTLVDVVNSVDIWLSDDKNFELGKVCLGIVANSKEINRIMFPDTNTAYMLHLLKSAQLFFSYKNPHIELDNNIHQIKKSFFRQEEDDTLSNLISKYVVKLLEKNKEKISIYYKGHRGALTYNIGNVSVIGNDFLVRNDEFDFFLDANSRKTISLRANGKIDVSKMSANLVGGGGHPNASGGLFNGFKDGFVYDGIKTQFENLIKAKE